jgi:ParB family transcriptional regulator, chromosome partitioning protein
MARQTLGRGLSALLGDEKPPPGPAFDEAPLTSSAASPSEVDIDLIRPNPQQPRAFFEEAKLEELAQSIRANGLVQPIVLRRSGDRYEIVAGERRWRAAQRAGLRKMPAVVREVSDDKLLELALIENIQRQELNPIEEGQAYRNLIENIGLTQEELAERVGKDRTLIATSMRLLKLPERIQELIINGTLSAGHGRALLLASDPQIQLDVANEAVEKGWSVRETERAAKARRSGRKPADQTPKTEDPNARAAALRLMRTLSTNVKIAPGKKGGGKIEIEYYSLDDFDRIYGLITGRE